MLTRQELVERLQRLALKKVVLLRMLRIHRLEKRIAALDVK